MGMSHTHIPYDNQTREKSHEPSKQWIIVCEWFVFKVFLKDKCLAVIWILFKSNWIFNETLYVSFQIHNILLIKISLNLWHKRQNENVSNVYWVFNKIACVVCVYVFV